MSDTRQTSQCPTCDRLSFTSRSLFPSSKRSIFRQTQQARQMIDVLLPLLLLATLIYALRRLPQVLTGKRHSHRLSQPGETGWTYEFTNKTFSLYTTAFNGLPRTVMSLLPPSIKRLYDLGSVSGALGVIAAMAGALWALTEVWRAVWAEARLHAMQKPTIGEVMAGRLTKRAMQHMAEGVPPSVSLSGGLQPLVRDHSQ
jgi:hypothetical protein